jgi:hypothetical protein
VNDSIGFRTAILLTEAVITLLAAVFRTAVIFDGLQEISSPSVVQEIKTLTNAPQWGGAELIWASSALIDAIR